MFRIVILIGSILMCSCAVMKPVQESQDYNLKKGDEFVIQMETNPSTGYSWSIEKGLADSVVTLQKDTYLPDKNLSGKPRLGASGTQKWYFTASQKGNTLLRFVYKRPGTNHIAKEKFVRVRVR